MHPDLPHLAFVPIEKLLHHERHDDSRTRPLVVRIRSSGILRNPPVVCPLQDGSGRYMVLDGANRITAFRHMGFPHALVQVVQPDDPGLTLQTWNHVVWELNADRFLKGIRSVPGIRLVPSAADAQPSLEGDCGLALLLTCKGRAYSLCTEAPDLEMRVDLLNLVVDSYRTRCRLDRTNSRNVETLSNIYPLFSGLMAFPRFQVQDIMCLAGGGCLLPSGITRFTISPRALHINYPLEELASNRPLESKNAALELWLKDRLDKKGVRYYAESTFLFDE